MTPVVGAIELIDTKGLKNAGYQEFASRIHEKLLRKTIGVTSSTVVDGKTEVKLLINMLVRPGQNSGFSFTENSINYEFDIRIDDTTRDLKLKYLYTTCDAKSKAINSYQCHGNIKWCNTTIYREFKKVLKEKGIKMNGYFEQSLGLGSWNCGCFVIGYGSACGICYPEIDTKNCVEIYEGISNTAVVKVCIYMNGESYCKELFTGGMHSGPISVIFTDTSILKDVGRLFAVKKREDVVTIKTGDINSHGSFADKFGNLQYNPASKTVNWKFDPITKHTCELHGSPKVKFDRCFYNFYHLFDYLKLKPSYKMRATELMRISSEELGTATMTIQLKLHNYKFINDNIKVLEFAIIAISGCFKCAEGSSVDMVIRIEKSGNYRINCYPPLLREIQNLKHDIKDYKFSFFSTLKKVEMTCTIGSVVKTRTVLLDDPVDRLIDWKLEVESHEVLTTDECIGWFKCNIFDYTNLNFSNLIWSLFPKLILGLTLCVILSIICYYTLKLISHCFSRKGRRMLRNYFLNVEKDKLMKRLAVMKSTEKYSEMNTLQKIEYLSSIQGKLTEIETKLVMDE